MKCTFCGYDEAEEELHPEALDDGKRVYVIRNVPSYGCDHCGNTWYKGETIQRMQEIFRRLKVIPEGEVHIADYTD
jgi:YgiT-type zinc finger domain-containing protein